MSMPMPMPASKKAPKKGVSKKPSPKAPAKKPAAKAPAKKPATKAPTKTPATKAPAKKPATTTNKPATKSPAKKPATATKKPATTYITDDFLTVQVFVESSANSRINDAKLKKCPLDEKTDPAAQPVICKVEAKSSTSFRTDISMIWIPPNEIAESVRGKNNPEKLKQQTARIQSAQMNPTNTLRFSVLNKVDPKNEKFGNQLMLPPGAFGDFIIKQCVPLKAGKPGGTTEFPAFNYRNQDADWNIAGNPFGGE